MSAFLIAAILLLLAALAVVCLAYSSLVREHRRLEEVYDQALRQLAAQEDADGEP